MKQLSWLSTIAVLALSSPAAAYDLITNGGFETGSLSSWQTFNQGASGGQGSWYPHSSGNGTYSGLPTSPPPAGAWQAVADNNGRAAAILYRDLTIPPTAKATLTFVLWYGNAAPGGYVNGSNLNPSNTNQRIRIDIIDPATNLLVTSSGVLDVIHATAPGSPAVFNPATITRDLTALAGQTVRLRVALVATNGGMIAGIDNVRLEVSPFAQFGNDLVEAEHGPARWGDIDGDGDFEILQFGNRDVPSITIGQIWWWQPLGEFWFPYTQLDELGNAGAAFGDFDRDGDLDVGAVGSSATRLHDLHVYQNYGWTSSIATPIPQPNIGFFEPGTYNGSFEWGDADLDGDLDAVFTGTGQQLFGDAPTTRIGFNDGAGSGVLLLVSSYGLPHITQGNAIWSDVNRDGALDVTLGGSDFAGVYLGGEGDFVPMPLSANLVLPVAEGAVATGDLDNDGSEELVVTGSWQGTPIAKVYRFDGFAQAWVELASLTGVRQSSVSLGDFDNDGWLDIAICGLNASSTALTSVYHNNGNGTFMDINAGLPGAYGGWVEFGDWDNDGDLDLVLQGHNGTNRFARVYQNSTPALNADPTPPVGLIDFIFDTYVYLGFQAYGSDDHTYQNVLTSNFRVGTSPGSIDLVAPMSNLATGRRHLPRPGDSYLSNVRILPLTGFGHGSLYWSAQTVDQSYRGSAWAPERITSIGPRITQVQDVPADQGRNVRLHLEKSVLDDEYRTNYQATGYNIWRLVPAGPMAQSIAREGVPLDPAIATRKLSGDRPASAEAQTPGGEKQADARTDLPLIEWNGRLFTQSPSPTLAGAFPPGTWEIIGSFFALQQPNYLVATSTLADSGASGPNEATFIVSVHTTTPSVWFTSLPASGHSVDNLAPAPPVGLAAAHHTGSGNQLGWQPAPEPDFASFHVYRGTTPDFVAGPSNLAATVSNPAWTDPSYDAPVVFYKVSTLDHAGNVSPAVAPGSTTATPIDPALPLEFALRAAAPNPFAGSTRLGFALPRASHVKLEVFDTAGRLVRSVLDGPFAAGEHSASWAGEDQTGGRSGTGVYFIRLQAGSFQATRRVVLMP